MRGLTVISVPFQIGRRDHGQGRGPARWLEAGLTTALKEPQRQVSVVQVERDGGLDDEISVIESVNRNLARAVRESVQADLFPLVLAGDCNSSIGTLGGLGSDRIAVVWFDAHGDFNTPATSPSGYFDGLTLSIAVGACYADLWGRVAARPFIAESDILMIGVRDLDPAERQRLDASQLGIASAEAIRSDGPKAVEAPLAALEASVQTAYVHFDVDALDPGEARCNSFQATDGISLEDAKAIIAMVGRRFGIRAAALTAFDPAFDEGGRAAVAGIELARHILDAAG